MKCNSGFYSFLHYFVCDFKLFVKEAIFLSSLLAGVFSINRKYALPTITASAPSDMYFFTSFGVDTPKPFYINNR